MRYRNLVSFLPVIILIHISSIEIVWSQNYPNVIERRHKVIEYAKERVVEISNSNDVFLGSGFFIDTLGKVFTASHVVYDYTINSPRDTLYYVSWYSSIKGLNRKWEIRSPSKIDTMSINYDAAILQLDLNESIPPLIKTVCLSLCDSLTNGTGDEVLCIGFIPGNFDLPIPFALSGMISTIRLDEMIPNKVGSSSTSIDIFQLDMSAAAGISGSPVIDLFKNEVIGYMVQVELPGDYKQSGFSTAYSITNVLDLIEYSKGK